MYKAKCGHIDEKEDNPKFAEITCQLIGCESCKFKTDIIFYKRDIKKGVGEWTKAKCK